MQVLGLEVVDKLFLIVNHLILDLHPEVDKPNDNPHRYRKQNRNPEHTPQPVQQLLEVADREISPEDVGGLRGSRYQKIVEVELLASL